jgi:GNAT superfamily N-acetyltransferase
MTLIPAGTEVSYRITYLEMTGNPGLTEPDMPDDVRLEHAVGAPVWFFLSMYDAVGRDYEWRDRFDQAEQDPEALSAFVGDPRVEMWVAYARGWPRGFFMLDWREAGVCDLAYFGVVPEAVGTGLGGTLLRTALREGMGTARCEDDGQHLHARPSPRVGHLPETWLSSGADRGAHPRP